MSYRGTEAPRLDYVERQYGYEVIDRPAFDVVEGGGIDARVRRGVSADFVVRVRLAMLAVAVFVILGAARVALTTATVTLLQSNLQMQTSIEAAEAENSSLRIERSVLSNTSRITRIATQNYGMVYVTSHDFISLPVEEEEQHLQHALADVETASSQNGSEAISSGRAPSMGERRGSASSENERVTEAVEESLADSSSQEMGLIDEVSLATSVALVHAELPINQTTEP